ncbi:MULTISPECIES: hypothetical protein [unclassified Dehalobacter]|uniref:hypothetical protein n=1 Tax=unclassified Dehalobacter TaxID=2635733 RepID=UPI000E6C35A5|nr:MULTISPECIES: hypothetical protein [unclassified Dehalobacter]RJE47196.1 hypothetical protein A7K50_04290 [Dehalobacter sp. MCB1]TCX53558.1 hypothetical protein C1I36_02115 [Dehalobacter sp. 14DCB1]TCX54943.1 hypothetical protein C1I38_04515 [Dehalobacter sp. 12DCB1]
MIVRAIFIGNTDEAYAFENFNSGLNIIFSDDNNKGKTIVIQSIMYCLGNIPAFPTSFAYEKYFHILYVEHNEELVKICRRAKNFVIKKGEEYAVFDNTAEFKRYWNKNIQTLPVIEKDSVLRIVDPELLVQLFFVGQDKKTTSDIVNKGWYRKNDFYSLLYAMAGINNCNASVEDVDNIKIKIKDLKAEKGILLKENKILKEHNTAFEYLSATNDKIALENTFKEMERVKDKLLALKKARANAVSRRTKNELTQKELRSLNRTMKTGQIACLDCGSKHIAYESADSEFSFDISTSTMRKQILDAVQEKIDIYNEEIDRLNKEIIICQRELDSSLQVDDISIEALLVVRQELESAKNADQRVSEIDLELQKLGEQLEKKEALVDYGERKCENLLTNVVESMNEFYKAVDIANENAYSDIFTSRDKIYSGSEATEFHLARMYAFEKILQHGFPIIVDSFRAEDLSSEREKKALQKLSELTNQIILTTTLKEEEENKYVNNLEVHSIDFSGHVTNKILTTEYVERFLTAANEMSVLLR